MIGRNNTLAGTAAVAAILLAVCLAAAPACAQANPPQQPKPADQQKPAPAQPGQSNPFPEDTNNVPVLPSGKTDATPAPTYAAAPSALPTDDADPVRSPDDPVPGTAASTDWSDSASAVPMDRIQPPPDDGAGKKHRRNDDQFGPPVEVHRETAQEDESVGSLYLDQHNWKGALSRFESAVVLDPVNPDVYWGLAEAQRSLGQFAAAKGNYLKVMEYDPDSKHAKEARKRLKEPDLANATAPAAPRN